MLEFEEILFGFATTDVRRLAFQSRQNAGVPDILDRVTEMAGWQWLK